LLAEIGVRDQADDVAPHPAMFYAFSHRVLFPFSARHKMQRWTARLLLLFALAGNFLPVALAGTTAPTHACCLRKAHKCHSLASTGSEPSVQSHGSCCDHECCRALTKSQWAHALAKHALIAIHQVALHRVESPDSAPASHFSPHKSSRAPPAC